MSSHAVGTMGTGQIAAHKLEGVAWGFFFIWIGVAFLLHLDWGIGLLGVGVLMVGKQLARKYMALSVETFWVVVGALFILCGIWASLSVRVSLLPIVCIFAGAALLFSALVSKPKNEQ
jgi:hypothetical protein